MAGNYLETVKSSLIKRLFNAETLSRKDVTANDIARAVGTNRKKVYRWLKKFGFEAENGQFKNDKSTEEVKQLIWSTLTGEEIEKLFLWSRKMRFNEKAPVKRRGYTLSDKALAARRADRAAHQKQADERAAAKNAALIAKMGIPSIEDAPVANTKEYQNSVEDRLDDFIQTEASTDKQASDLLHAILFGSKPMDETVAAMKKLAMDDNPYKAKQWAFKTFYNQSTREQQATFQHEVAEAQQGKKLLNKSKLFNAYRQNQEAISLDALRGEQE